MAAPTERELSLQLHYVTLEVLQHKTRSARIRALIGILDKIDAPPPTQVTLELRRTAIFAQGASFTWEFAAPGAATYSISADAHSDWLRRDPSDELCKLAAACVMLLVGLWPRPTKTIVYKYYCARWLYATSAVRVLNIVRRRRESQLELDIAISSKHINATTADAIVSKHLDDIWQSIARRDDARTELIAQVIAIPVAVAGIVAKYASLEHVDARERSINFGTVNNIMQLLLMEIAPTLVSFRICLEHGRYFAPAEIVRPPACGHAIPRRTLCCAETLLAESLIRWYLHNFLPRYSI